MKRNLESGRQVSSGLGSALALLAAAVLLTACGTTMEQRAASGAAAGLVVGGPVGAAVGAAVGAVVNEVEDGQGDADESILK